MEFNNLRISNYSFLKARDPSILSYNFPKLTPVKANLNEQFDATSDVTKVKQEEEENLIRIYLRIKKFGDFQGLYEVNGNKITSFIQPGTNSLGNTREGQTVKKTYSFTKIFNSNTSQRDIFNDVVKPKILDFINGQNSTLLTYGASGSGKTFTVIGTDMDPGVVPRSLEYLFRSLPKISRTHLAKPTPAGEVTMLNEADCKKEKLVCRSLLNSSSSLIDRAHHRQTYLAMQQRLSTEPIAELDGNSNISVGVWVSFAEIYNEQIYDLLQTDPPRGQQRQKLRLGMSNGKTYIKNLTDVSVTSGEEAYQILQYGIHNLNYAPTQLNKHSSRSHSIFTIRLVQVNDADNEYYVSNFNFCDLAGSERSKKTQNVGDRLKESNNINNSLLVLGRCISSIRNLQKQNDQRLVPFRESKLTQLFQKALSGAEDIAMIVNMSPSKDMFDESQHVLNFAAIAKDITIDRKPEPKQIKKSRFSTLMDYSTNDFDELFSYYKTDDYQQAILLLKQEIETQKHDMETTHQANLHYIRQEYDKLLNEMEEETKARIEKAERSIRVQYEAKMSNMRLTYENSINALKRKEVIEIDSSDDDDEPPTTKRPKIFNSKRSVELALRDGVEDYKNLEEKYNKLEQEYLRLQDEHTDLLREVEYHRSLRAFGTGNDATSEDQSQESDTDCRGELTV